MSAIERVPCIVLAVNTLRTARPLDILTLGAVTVARSLICYDTTSYHTEGTTIFTLSSSLLHVLILAHLAVLPARKINGTTRAFHRTHRQLGQIVRVTCHCGVHIVSRASALVQHLLLTLLIALAACTPLLHICRSVPRNVCVVRESASELGLVAVSLAASGILTLLISLVLSVRLLIIQYLNILIIIIII